MGAKRVLVAEDDVLTSLTIREALSELGIEVIAASAFHDALELASNAALDAGIVNLDLNGISTGEVVGTLLSRGIPAILAGGHPADRLPRVLANLPRLQEPLMSRDVQSTVTAALALSKVRSPR